MSSRRLRSERGQMLAVTAITLVLLVAMAGLAIDGGLLMERKRRAQTAADAAAIAAAADVFRDSAVGLGTITTTGRDAAAANGFTDGTEQVTVTINRPPTQGPYAGSSYPDYVEAIVEQTQPTVMLRVLSLWQGYGDTETAFVRARAVAGPLQGSGGGACVHVLDPTMDGALTLSGSANLEIPQCDVRVNSCSEQKAVVMSGSSYINSSSTTICGGVTDSSSGDINPAPTFGPGLDDPFADLTPPSYSGPSDCDHTGTYTASAGEVLQPGVYCGGIKNGSAGVSMAPGLYILVDGKFEQSGGGSSITGSEVTIYMRAEIGDSTCTNCKVVVSGGGYLDLTAPTSGEYEGMLFWQDANVGDMKAPNKISGGSNMDLEGVLYFPANLLEFSGGSNAPGEQTADYTVIVSNQLKLSGPSYLGGDFSSLASGSPFASATVLSLAE